MRTAYFDCFSGISGDMTIGALIDAGFDFDDLELLQLPGVLAVVGQVVVAVRHPGDRRHTLASADHHHRDQPAGVRLEDEMDQVEPGPQPGEEIDVAVDTRQLHFFDVESGAGIYDDA